MSESSLPRSTRRAWLRRDVLAMLASGLGLAACDQPAVRAVISGRQAERTPFPEDIPIYTEDYRNWCGALSVRSVPTCAPRSPSEACRVANWAAQNGVALRPRGARHGWSPLTIAGSAPIDPDIVLADTQLHLHRVQIIHWEGRPAVRAGAGTLLEDMLATMQAAGYGFTAIPAVGEITLGGALAIGAHGSAVPARGESALPQQSYGSLSNRVLELTAIVWSETEQRYVLETMRRSDSRVAALLTALGRCFLTEAVLAVEPDQNLRCQSFVNIPATELFAAPGSGGRDIASYLDSAGRVESLWYPFTDAPWLKVWSVSPSKPALSRRVRSPYNYPFSDNIPEPVAQLAANVVNRRPELTPLFGQSVYAATVAGLAATASYDLWGPSANTLLFIKSSTLRVNEFAYAVLTRRADVQQVIHDHAQMYLQLLEAYQQRGEYPVNMPLEYRVSGVDHAAEIGLSGAQTATLSALRPREDRSDWDTIVWLSVLTLTETPGQFTFFREFEDWMYTHYDGRSALLRPEWSKGWAYTGSGAWEDVEILEARIPELFRAGSGTAGWDAAFATLERLDPAGVFRTPLHFDQRVMTQP